MLSFLPIESILYHVHKIFFWLSFDISECLLHFSFSPLFLTRWFEVFDLRHDYDYWIKPLSVKIWIWWRSQIISKRQKHSINLQCHLCSAHTNTKIYILIRDNVIYIHIAISLFFPIRNDINRIQCYLIYKWFHHVPAWKLGETFFIHDGREKKKFYVFRKYIWSKCRRMVCGLAIKKISLLFLITNI
jgi:hypothetical protein